MKKGLGLEVINTECMWAGMYDISGELIVGSLIHNSRYSLLRKLCIIPEGYLLELLPNAPPPPWAQEFGFRFDLRKSGRRTSLVECGWVWTHARMCLPDNDKDDWLYILSLL